MYSKILFFSALGLFFLAPVLWSLSDSDLSLISEGTGPFNEALEDIWSGGSEKSYALLDSAERLFLKISDARERIYRQGTVYLNRGRLALALGDKKAGLKYLKEAMDLADEALSNGDFSEGYRVWADAGSIFMVNKGLFAIIKIAAKVSERSYLALKLDPGNIKAIIISAQGKINAPKRAGGDPEKARIMLEKLIKMKGLSKPDKFQTALSLSQVYSKLKDRDKAEYWCSYASEIYPENMMDVECRKALKL